MPVNLYKKYLEKLKKGLITDPPQKTKEELQKEADELREFLKEQEKRISELLEDPRYHKGRRQRLPVEPGEVPKEIVEQEQPVQEEQLEQPAQEEQLEQPVQEEQLAQEDQPVQSKPKTKKPSKRGKGKK